MNNDAGQTDPNAPKEHKPGGMPAAPGRHGPQASDHPHTEGLDPELAHRFGLAGDEWIDTARRAVREPDDLGRLGGYRLVQEIGRGAQGAVYKAVQPGTGRIVALKRLGAGFLVHLRHREHLQREVEALTLLSHPNVVTVFAAEELDGHPVLIMEYVDGISIDRWADALWAAGCSARSVLHAVLTCFLGFCDGVAHAHQRGVIHCDIKPSNALVTTLGVAKVLDFGIARVTNQWRDQGAALSVSGFAGTPAYAAPEQVLGSPRSIDTRCDVYSLGVLLRRLITGVDLFGPDATLAQIVDAARTGPGLHHAPSRVRAALPRDLDWVVRKAMHPDPGDRYQSVDAFADDIRRVLAARATLAHPPSWRYTAARFVLRHRWACVLAGAAMLVIMSLASVSTVQAVRLQARQEDLTAALKSERLASAAAAAAQRDAEIHGQEAKAERDRQQRTAAFLLGLVETIAQGSEGRTTIPIEDLVRWIDTPEQTPVGGMDATVRARLSLALGAMYRFARRNDLAIKHDQRALDILTRPGDEPLRLRALVSLSAHQATSVATAREAVAYMQQVGLQDSPQAIETWRQLSAVAGRRGFFDQAIEALREARAIAQRTNQGVDTRALLVSDEAARQLTANRLEDAAATARRSLDMIPPELHASTDASRRATIILGEVTFRQGNVPEAERLFATASKWFTKDLGDGHIRTRNAMRWHARALHELRRYDEAATIFERLIQLIPPDQETIDKGVWMMRFRYAATLLGQGRTQEADRQLRRAITHGGAAPSPTLEAEIALARKALEQTQLKFTPALRKALDHLGWLVDFTSDPAKREEPT